MTYTIDNLPVEGGVNFAEDTFVGLTLQNAKNLLMTKMGEVPYDRFRGFNQRIYDLPLPELKTELLPELDRVMMWEPDVEVVEADAFIDDDGATVIEVVLEI